MLEFTIYSADCTNNKGNCLYPNKAVITDKDTFIKAIKTDHVTAKYKGNYRKKENFEYSDCIPLDCDNDHSENPKDWVTPFDIALEIPNINFIASYSRHHMLSKGNQSARPRFHIFFPVPTITTADEYTFAKKRIASSFPYFDSNALDSARFLYGTDSENVEEYEGSENIIDLIDKKASAEFEANLSQIPEGKRNNTMSYIAG